MKTHARAPRSPIRDVSKALLAMACATTIGCRDELGPTRPPLARVRGRVTVRGAPIGGGWIEFHPIEGTLGDPRSAPLNLDGSFVAEKVAIGRNAIVVAHSTVIPRSLRPGDRLLPPVRTIERDGQVLDIDLADDRRGARPAN